MQTLLYVVRPIIHILYFFYNKIFVSIGVVMTQQCRTATAACIFVALRRMFLTFHNQPRPARQLIRWKLAHNFILTLDMDRFM